jgi:integrase
MHRLPADNVRRVLYIKEAFAEFVAMMKSRDRSQTTINNYIMAFRTIVKGDYILHPANINKSVKAFLEDRTDLSNSSLNIYMKKFQVFLNFCSKKKYIDKMEMYSENKRNAPNKKVVPFEDEEFDMIIDKFMHSDYEYALMLLFMRHTGSRIGETLDLKWEKVNIKDKLINFPNKINKAKFDEFPITKGLMNIISEIEKLSETRTGSKRDKLFRWKPGMKSSLCRSLIKVEKELGTKVPGNCFHRIRKKFSRSLFNNNLPLKDIRKYMRHKNIQTTIMHYE